MTKIMTDSTPRWHHYLPAFYLTGFTASQRRDDSLLVLDMEQRKEWRSKPDKLAYIRNYYHVEVPNLAVDKVERGSRRWKVRPPA